ncbi:MAG: sigma-70 family RNA polymerase sigma factor [Bacteroidales bacterium]|nr:sigma-70 family RNA polymerase sigma factor [Bacteroidales bacterium]
MKIVDNNSHNFDYASIINKYKDLAYNIALKITRNEQDSEEIVQDSFLKAFKGLDQFKYESQFSTWFYRIVYNTAISSIRKKKLQSVEINSNIITRYENSKESVYLELDDSDRKNWSMMLWLKLVS